MLISSGSASTALPASERCGSADPRRLSHLSAAGGRSGGGSAAGDGDPPAHELLGALLADRPDIAIIDVRLPPTFTDEGLRTALEARRRLPGLPVLVLSQYVEQLYARELLSDRAGSVGYLLKDRVFSDDQFVEALRTVAAGGTVLDLEVVRRRQSPGPRRPGLPELLADSW